MAEQALGTGIKPRRRVLFGWLDGDGWPWAIFKATFWFVVIIFMMGYLPDRAYYFVVNRTLEVGINAVSLVNFCPSANGTLPCPAPVGAIVPWQPAPAELALPEGRSLGGLVQSGTRLLYVGGTNGTVAQQSVIETTLSGGSYSPWAYGVNIPGRRVSPAVVFFGGGVYVIGGTDETGAATTTVFQGNPDPSTGQITSWKAVDELTLPAGRTGAAAAIASDGILLIGGSDGSGPTATVYKSTVDAKGRLTKWTTLQDMPQPRTLGIAALLGDYLYVYGGSDAAGPTAEVLRGHVYKAPTKEPTAEESARTGTIDTWAAATGPSRLPYGMDGATGFAANGSLYIIGGIGNGTSGQVFWAVPDANGNIPQWTHLVQSDLNPALNWRNAASVASGSYAYIVGGETTDGVTRASARANLAPESPFFQLGILGATIPALEIPGEIGQQLGYLAAAGVATANFVILILIGLAFAYREKTIALFHRLRRRRSRGSAT